MIASIRDLRASTKEILSAVNRGDTIVITNRGKPYAKIVPIDDNKKKIESSQLFGIWKNKKIGSVKKYVRKMREGRVVS